MNYMLLCTCFCVLLNVSYICVNICLSVCFSGTVPKHCDKNIPLPLCSIDWSAVIVDEAHKIKNPNSQITQAMKELRCKVGRLYVFAAIPVYVFYQIYANLLIVERDVTSIINK